MKTASRLLLALLAALLCLASVSCTYGGGDDTGAQTTESTAADTTISDTTKAPEPEPEGFSVPTKLLKDGKLLWEYTYSPDGKKMTKTVYTEESPITYTTVFDDNGKPLYTEWVIVINSERSEIWRDEYDEFDGDGRITLERRYCEGDIQNAFAYTYDAEGRMETQTTRNVQQKNTIYRLLYDERGTHVGTRYSKYNGEAGYYHPQKTCTYDEDGRILTEVSDTLNITHEYKVQKSKVLSEKITMKSGEFSISYYTKNTYVDGLLSLCETYYEDVLTEETHYEKTDYQHYLDAVNWIHRERLP